MANVVICSPTNGSNVMANQEFAVSVSWDANIGFKKKRKAGLLGAKYTVSCTDATVPAFPTDEAMGLTSFNVMAGAAGTSKTVTVSLHENDAAGDPTTPLASGSVTVNVPAGTPPGTIGGIGVMGKPVPAKSALTAAPAKKYVCGTYHTNVANLIVVTYQVVVDRKVPRDGKPGGPDFTISTRRKKVKQYSVYKGNLSMAAGKWQATVKANITDPADGYQFEVWFLDANWVVLGSGSKALEAIVQDAPCP